MIYGNKFYGYNIVNESVESRINKYKELLDKAIELLEVRYKWLELDSQCFEKVYPIYMNINEKNAENNYKEIKRLIDQYTKQCKKIYDYDQYNNDKNNLNHKITRTAHLLFTELPLLKNDEVNKIKSDFNNKLTKIEKDTDKYFNKYKDYMENVGDSKIYQSIANKSSEISDIVPYIFEKYDNIDDGPADIMLDQIRSDIKTINASISSYRFNFLINNKHK